MVSRDKPVLLLYWLQEIEHSLAYKYRPKLI